MESPRLINSIAIFPDLPNTSNSEFKMNEFLSESLVRKNSLKSQKPRNIFYQKKIKTQMPTKQSTDLPFLSKIDLNQSNISKSGKSTNFIKKKLNEIKNSSIGKTNKIYRTELNLTQNLHERSKSRQNLCKSVLKKLSSKLSSTANNDKIKIYTQGCEAIQANFSFFNDQINSFSVQRKSTGQKIRQSFEAYAKNENERMLRLIQKQEEMEEKYSSLKVNLKKQVEKNASKKLSKKDFYLYSKSLETNRHPYPQLQFRISQIKFKRQ